MNEYGWITDALTTGGPTVGALVVVLGWLKQRLDKMEKRHGKDMESIGGKIDNLTGRVSTMEGRVQGWMDRKPTITGGANGKEKGQ